MRIHHLSLATVLCFFLFLSSTSLGDADSSKKAPDNHINKTDNEVAQQFDHSHAKWTKVLKNFVIVKGPKSEVNYKALKSSPELLDDYLSELEKVTEKDFKTWTKEERLSFWINAYNAYTIKLILNNYPVDSIKSIGSFFSNPWKKEFFKLHGRDMHLDRIEHDIIRKKFNEPRIHFALNCASIGCPALRQEAYQADKLDLQLEEQTKTFLRDESRNKVDHKKERIYLSKIFDWFEDDFEKNDSTVKKFVLPYMIEDEAKRDKAMDYSVRHTDYDWKLNEVK